MGGDRFQGEGVLAEIARELWVIVGRDVKTDWTVRDDVRASLRAKIRRCCASTNTRPTRPKARSAR